MRRASAIVLVFLLTVSCALCVTACGDDGSGEAAGGGFFDPGLQQELENTLNGIMAENGIPGAIIYVEVPGEGKWEAALGLSDVEAEEAMDLTNKYRIGSITKTFVATVILQLVDEGKISLEDTLDTLGMESLVPHAGEITVRMLLNHTSGLFEYTADETFQEMQDENPRRKWAPDELVEFAARHEPYFSPGDGWQYSNTNFILQGIIVEKITGNDLEDEIASRIAKVLGLSETNLPTQPEMSGEYNHGYLYARDLGEDEAGSSDRLFDVTDTFDPSWAWAAGAMISDLDDLKVWAKSLAEGDLLSDSLQKERLTTVEAWQGSDYGLGIAEYAGFWGHPGDLPGFSSAMMYNPENGTYIVLTLNKNPNEIDFAGYATFTELVDILFPSSSGDGE